MNRIGNERIGNTELVLPVAAKTVISEATMVAINESGYAVPASKAENLVVAGCAQKLADNALGGDGDICVQVRRGTFVWENSGDIAATDLLKEAYVSDETSVTKAADGSSRAGIILAVDPDGVTVDMTANCAAAQASEAV